MYFLSDDQVDFISMDIRRHGIEIESLQQSLLDHICILIEQNLEQDGDFHAYYNQTITTFYKQELREIEEETLFLINHKGPGLLLSRNVFFLLLFTIFIGPFIGWDISWMFSSNQVQDLIHGQAHGLYLPLYIWGPTVTFSLFPLLVLFVLFLTPDRFDPLIPKKAKVLLGGFPFLRIVLVDDKSTKLDLAV
ncbi:hypothetical protein ACX0G9_30090 [Flavitalea flava]